MAEPAVPATSTFAIAADLAAATVNFALALAVTARFAPPLRTADGIVIAIAALNAAAGVPANTKVTVASPSATAVFAVTVMPDGSLVTQAARSALSAITLKVSPVRVTTASTEVMAEPAVPATSTFAIAADLMSLEVNVMSKAATTSSFKSTS